ncbi:MAG: hypothetical protein KAH38_04545, partial [Candidatus Hydrogenedentes bacterium]|nr:hypothetical protein [Candidatus Hydrogenedentota bacterium]
MKKTVVTVFIAMLVFTMFAQANDAVLEQVMLLRLAEKADVSDYVMVEILQGYRQYRSVLDDLDTERAEISIALLAAIKANESSSKLMSLTHELMDIDMEILETKQGAVDEAVSAIGAEAAAELYLVVSDLDKAKANLLAELSGKPDCSSCPNAAPACTAAVVANPE